jgi:hypothetical protein
MKNLLSGDVIEVIGDLARALVARQVKKSPRRDR